MFSRKRWIPAGVGVLVSILAGIAWVSSREHRVDLEIVNQTGGPVSDLVVTVARQEDFEPRRNPWKLFSGLSEGSVVLPTDARRRTFGSLADTDRCRFPVAESELFVVKIDYRDARGDSLEDFALFQFFGPRIGHFTVAGVFLQPRTNFVEPAAIRFASQSHFGDYVRTRAKALLYQLRIL